MRGKNNLGLTLVELIIVVVILGILILIVIAYFRSQLFKGNDAKRKGDINRIKIAVEEYEKDHGCYPPPSIMNCDPGTGLRPYLDKIPCDPVTHASYFYDYQDNVCPNWYKIYGDLENNADDSLVTGIGPNGAFNYVSGSPNAPGEVSSGGGEIGFYGCVGGVCTQISWDASRPGPECDPNYQSSGCYGQCGQNGGNECVSWK